jgi:AcrR family transcriptional regulator
MTANEEKILRATIEVSGKGEPHRFSTKEVAMLAGVSEFMVYDLFKTKDNLIAQADTLVAQDYYDIMLAEAKNFRGYQHLMNRLYDFYLAHPYNILFSINYCRVFPQVVLPADYETFKATLMQGIETIGALHPFAKSIDPFSAWNDFTREVVAQCYFFIAHPEADTPETREMMARLLFEGVGPYIPQP